MPGATKKHYHFQLWPFVEWTVCLLAAALLLWALLRSWAGLIPR
jgi:hypothetical protein